MPICAANLTLSVAFRFVRVPSHRTWLAAFLLAIFLPLCSKGAQNQPVSQFQKNIQPILAKYCYDCHGDGMAKGDVAFDELKSDKTILDHDLWLRAIKNLRAGLMPPEGKERPSADELKQIENWIKYSAFEIDPKNPDPGRITIRRLNRAEYRNTIRDLMGVEFDTASEFPPDDTGYGFDNIGDVLTISPMLLEKYMAAATTIVNEAVPSVDKVIQVQTVSGSRFRREDANADSGRGNRGVGRGGRDTMQTLSFYEPVTVANTVRVDETGTYNLKLQVAVKGQFEFDPGKCRIIFKIDGQVATNQQFGWQSGKTYTFDFERKWKAGEHRLTLELQPLTPVEQRINSLEMRLVSVAISGPTEEKFWTSPKNYARFFSTPAPTNPAERDKAAHETLRRFATKAFRRPVDEKTVDRLAAIAQNIYTQPGKTFETGVSQALIAVISSPRFLFRIEESVPGSSRAAYALVDEYALASRLSYFLWASMPDDELFNLAAKGELRKNLSAQVTRMLADARSEQMVKNFTGQWLETRDVDGISINALVVLARDSGTEKQLKQQQEDFRLQASQRRLLQQQAGRTNAPGGTNQFAQPNAAPQIRRQQPPKPRIELTLGLRQAMRQETEMFFSSVVKEDRSVRDLIDADYTFLNEKLAELYGLTNLNVTGDEMRRVTLPPDSGRGGVLTEGSVLVVTSNPDRTSPVKRGLFVLNNILGTPPAPPPPNIPALEASESTIKDHEPLLRESLALHRSSPLCSSCHSRMDPIGLAFENFNALGMWRDKERNQPIEAGGVLATGETFKDVNELKRILVTNHREEFYRCLTGKFLTFALGRGAEYYDTETIDQIVKKLDQEDGRFSALLMGVIESAPFQKQRNAATLAAVEKPGTVETQIAKTEKQP